MSLLDLGMNLKKCGKLLDEAAIIVKKISGEYDYLGEHLYRYFHPLTQALQGSIRVFAEPVEGDVECVAVVVEGGVVPAIQIV